MGIRVSSWKMVLVTGYRPKGVAEGGREGGKRPTPYLPPRNHHPPIRRPRDRKPLPSQLHSGYAALGPHVPEPTRAVRGDGGELGFFGWVPGHALDAGGVAA